MPKDIVLIGPIGAGKTTVAELLAKRLSLRHLMMDEIRWDLYNEAGYNADKAERLRQEGGFWSRYRYWKPFEAYATQKLLSTNHNCIFDLGAGHSVFEDPILFEKIANLLKPYENVILLLPSRDDQESLRILDEREPEIATIMPSVNEHFLKQHSNRDLAKHTIYTKNKTPQETCEEIIEIVGMAKEDNEALKAR